MMPAPQWKQGEREVNRYYMNGLKIVRLTLGIAALVLLAILFCAQIGLASDLTPDDVKSLDGLETRFFEHTYPKDDPEARLDRLEKLIFGEVKQGDQNKRLQDIVATVPKNTEIPADPGAGGGGSDGGDDSGQTQTASNGGDDSGSSSSGSGDDDSGSDGTDYPRVDAIEQIMLGKTFKTESITKRLGQLEIKAFNKASTDPDLSQRVSNLEEYVQKHMHKSVDQLIDPRSAMGYQSPDDNDDNVRAPGYAEGPGGNPGTYSAGNYGGGYSGQSYGSGSYGMSSPGANASAPSAMAPDQAQVAWLETRVYGRPSNPNVPLIDRLKRLETTVFPSEQMDPNVPIPNQIRLLVNAVELMHSSQPGQSTVAQGAQQGYAQTQQQAYQPTQQAGAGQNFPSWPPQGSSTSSNQYSGYSAYAGQSQPGTYPYQGQAGDTGSSYPTAQQQVQQQQQQQPEEEQKHGHPLLKGLAHALMSVGSMAGSMAASSMMYGGMGGMGGYGGYGGMYNGAMGGYGSGMMPGFGGIHF